MCRWVAYAGPEIYLEDILFNQDHSIVNQSLSAHESVWTTNGDGFGVAWYTQRTIAGLLKVRIQFCKEMVTVIKHQEVHQAKLERWLLQLVRKNI